jgi:dTDP-4-dehydrorhamnose reductase
MARLLITGGAGLLGLNWALHRRNIDEVHTTLYRRNVVVEGVHSHVVDLGNAAAVARLIDEVCPEVIVHTAGMTDVDGCQINPEKSYFENFETAKILANCCNESAVKLVHISTDHLSDGAKPLVCETDEIGPLNVYAMHKADAEKAILNHAKNALVIRTSFFGWGPEYRRSFSDHVLDNLSNGVSSQMFDDVFFTPISTRRLIALTHEALDFGLQGVLNICGHERISKYEFSTRLAEAFGYDGEVIQPVQAFRQRDKTPRPSDMSLSNKKMAAKLGCPQLDIDTMISDLQLDDAEIRQEIRRIGKIIPYGKHFVDNADIRSVCLTLRSNNLTQGPKIPEFEERIAAYVGAKYAVAVSSATAGLHLSYKALGLGAQQSVLTSPITFVSTANAAFFCGGDAKFADINKGTINIDLAEVDKILGSDESISIVAPVIFAGATDGIPEVARLAKSKGKKVVEDAAHGLGASYSCGALVGSCKYSDCTVFSLHPVKSIAAGEGGVVTTNDFEVYRSLLRLRSHGINKSDDTFINSQNAFTNGELNPWYYEMTELGYHYRITDIQASLALSQLGKIDDFLSRRRTLAHRYASAFEDNPFVMPAQNIDLDRSANHLFPVAIDFDLLGKTRLDLVHALRAEGIITQVHYIPVVMNPFYVSLGHNIKNFPNSYDYYSKALSLPLYFGLDDDDFDHVIKVIDRAFRK